MDSQANIEPFYFYKTLPLTQDRVTLRPRGKLDTHTAALLNWLGPKVTLTAAVLYSYRLKLVQMIEDIKVRLP